MAHPSKDCSKAMEKHEEDLDSAALEEFGVYDDVSHFDCHVKKLQKLGGGYSAAVRSHGYSSAAGTRPKICEEDTTDTSFASSSRLISPCKARQLTDQDVLTSPRLLGGPGFLARRRMKRPSSAVDFALLPMEICVENTPNAGQGAETDFFKAEEIPPSCSSHAWRSFAPMSLTTPSSCSSAPPALLTSSCAVPAELPPSACAAARWSLAPMSLKTPSSCSSVSPYTCLPMPRTPEPKREELTFIEGDVRAIIFDFDGTLTASPGEVAIRGNKQDELCERSSLLEPRLRALREAGLTLGIMSKSSEMTIRSALRGAGLSDFFNGPLVAKAVGFEGKAGFIKDLVQAGDLGHLGEQGGLARVLLVDDCVYELERAVVQGIQTYAVPEKGGLQDKDFDQIFAALGLPVAGSLRTTDANLPATTPCLSTNMAA